MPNYLIEHRIRVRNRADSADLLLVNSVRGDTSAYLKEPPVGDGQGFNPLTNEALAASYTGRIVDAITSGTTRVVTSQLEDVNNRLQLGYLKTYVESRRDGGSWSGTFGYLTVFRLVADAEWEFSIQDPSVVYDGFELFNSVSTETISSFLAAWPNRGCLLGGPIIGTWMSMPDLGGWTMRVHRVTTLDGHLGYWLSPVTTFGPGRWASGGEERFNSETADAINAAVRTLPTGTDFAYKDTSVSTIADAYGSSLWWTGLVYLIDGAVFRPIPPFVAGVKYGGSGGHFDGQRFDAFGDSLGDLVSVRGILKGLFAYDDGQGLADSSIVRVRALTVLPSDVSPILLDRHPVDHLTDCWTLAGLSYNAAACTALKEQMGPLRHAMRIKGSRKMGEHLREAALQFGIATRVNGSGELVPFSTRIFANTVPTKTITDALVVQGTTRAFELDALDGLQRVTLRQKGFDVLAGKHVTGVLENDIELTLNNGSANPMVSGTIEITTDGMLRADPASKKAVGITWLATLAEPLFERFGAGCQGFFTDLIRGDGTSDADMLNLGDEVLVNVKQIPNHNKRYGDDSSVGARALQVIQITELVDRRRVVLKDSGPNAQALATTPTHTIAASTDLPRAVAELTITNAAALNALAYAVVIQIAVTTGAAPALTDYVDAYRSAAAAIPTTAIRLPHVTAGRKVYARARSEKTGSRPSDWSTGVSVTLTAISAPSGASATAVPIDGSKEDLAWTIGSGSTDCYTDVYVRAFGASFSTAIKKTSMLPGSVACRLNGLSPNTQYTASLQHRDANTQDASALTEVSFTTDAAVYTLLPPILPDGFSFPANVAGRSQHREINDDAARYGIAVVAQEFPGTIEVAEAVETAVGAGTYGAYASVGRVPAISGDWTVWANLAPQDGLRRKLKARAIGDGQTASAYCDEVVVTPNALDSIETFPLSIANFREKTRASTTITTQWENKGTAVEIWLWYVVSTQPVAADPWPVLTTDPTKRLTSDTTEYTFDIPDQNSILHGILVPIGPGAVAGVPWRFTLQPSTATRIVQRARILSTTAQSVVVRVEVANPIAGGDVSIAYVSSGLTVTPASPQTVSAANVPTDLANAGGLTNYVDFTITRPAPGANDRVTFTATSTDRIADVDAIDIPALDGIPQGVVSISAAGACTLTLDGGAWVASFKYAESTSAYPSDATARAGTTVNGRQAAIALSSTLAVGDSVYVTVLPYSVTGAGGVEGASVRFRATRHDFSASKTVHFGASGFTPYAYGGNDAYKWYQFTNGYMIAEDASVAGMPAGLEYTDNLQVPLGVTITDVAADLYTDEPFTDIGARLRFELFRVDSSGGQTSIGSVTSEAHGGWETLTFNCSELASSGRRYRMYLMADYNTGSPTTETARIAGYQVSYSMPSSTVTL